MVPEEPGGVDRDWLLVSTVSSVGTALGDGAMMLSPSKHRHFRRVNMSGLAVARGRASKSFLASLVTVTALGVVIGCGGGGGGGNDIPSSGLDGVVVPLKATGSSGITET